MKLRLTSISLNSSETIFPIPIQRTYNAIKDIYRAASSGWACNSFYTTNSDEALVLQKANARTHFVIRTGTAFESAPFSVTPDVDVVNGHVYINSAIGFLGSAPGSDYYNLKVGGSAYSESLVLNAPASISSGSLVARDSSGNVGTTSISFSSDITSGQTPSGSISPAILNYNAALRQILRNLDLSSLDENTWYPIVFPYGLSGFRDQYCHVTISVALDSGTAPSWSTHSAGFSCLMDLYLQGSGWGTTNARSYCMGYDYYWCNSQPLGYSQMSNSSSMVIWARGGGIYHYRGDCLTTPEIMTSSYTLSDQTVSPGSTNPGLILSKPLVYVDLANFSLDGTTLTINNQ